MAIEPIGVTIDQWVEMFLPAGFVVSQDFVDKNKRKWQLYLYDAIDPHIEEADVYTETKWPDLANILIAYLIVYDVLMQVSVGGFITAISGSTTDSSGSSTTGQGNGPVKKIVTGPTEIQWYDVGTTLSDILKTSGSDGALGVLGQIMQDACAIANKLGIKLPFCHHAKTVHGFIKAGAKVSKCCSDVLNKYGSSIYMG